MPDAIEAMRDAFAQLSAGNVEIPVRTCLAAENPKNVDLVMPCYSSTSGVFSLKTVTVFPGNSQCDLPTNQGLVILTDGLNGTHQAIMDGSSLTAIRTGAASGLATDLLARSDSSAVSIFGAGVQARTQLEAVCCVRKIGRASVYSRRSSTAAQFATEMTERLGLPVTAAATPSENVSGADVICTATPSIEPILDDADVADGVHINAVGAFRPEMVEIAAATVSRSRVVVDHLESALEEAGDLIQPLQQGLVSQAHIADELGDVARGHKPGRSNESEVTLFKSVGVAVQDLCAAAKVVENASRMGLGVLLK